MNSAESNELSKALRREADYFRAPAGLRARIAAQIALDAAKPQASPDRNRRATRAPWFIVWPGGAGGLAGSMAATLLAFALGLQWGLPSGDDRLLEQATSDHARASLTDHAVDIAASDPRLLVPWLSGRVDFTPRVRDLAAGGFQLQGARLDYLDQRRVAVVVYRGQRHDIDVFSWPVAPGSRGLSGLVRHSHGYSVVRWSEGGMNFCAVSDAEASELERLRRLMPENSAA